MTSRSPIIALSFQLLSNWCSMGCAGCGIRVAPPSGDDVVAVDEQHLGNARRTFQAIKVILEGMGLEYAMIEQSGGEPTHHPAVIETLGEVFAQSVHKIITNGLPSQSIYSYLKKRGDQAFLVLSIDHHEIAFNRIRLGGMLTSQPARAMQIHDTVLRNLALLANSDIPLVVSTIISKWNVAQYLGFVAWLEERYPRQIQEGKLVPVPVSLVSFGNQNLGKLNPSPEQVSAFEEAIDESRLLTVRRTREWLLKPLIGHYRNKERFFAGGESLDQISLRPSRYSCEIFRHMISFNYQDEEIFRPPEEALFEGYSCGVKVLGNIGHTLDPEARRPRLFPDRPSNTRTDKKYYRVDQLREYVNKWESVTNDREVIQMGDGVGYFSDLRRGMCLLDDFDGVWWPFNVYLQGIVDDATIGDYWSLFRNRRFVETLRRARENTRSNPHAEAARSDPQRV